MKAKQIGKLKKLIRHMRSARAIGNKHEADAYAQAIVDFRKRHQIFEEVPLDEDADFVIDDFDGELLFSRESPLFKKRRIIWEEILINTLAAFFGCSVAIQPKTNLKILIGSKDARNRVRQSYLFLYEDIKKEAEKFSSQKRNSFFHGFNAGLIQKLSLYKTAEQKIQEMKDYLGDVPENSQALVKSQKIIISERRTKINARMNAQGSDSQAPPEININPDLIDVEAFSAGAEYAHSCALSDELALPMEKISEEFDLVQTRARRKHEKQRFHTTLQREVVVINSIHWVQPNLNFDSTDK